MKNIARIIVLVSIVILSSACSQQVQPTPLPTETSTPTSAPTNTPIPTSTSTPTITPTEDMEAFYRSLLPEIPSGFEWRIIPEEKLAVLIPDGWFFKQETYEELNLSGVFVTVENIDEVGRFSTGLSVFVYKSFESEAEAEQAAVDMLQQISVLETTKEIINSWDYNTGSKTVHHLRIRAEFLYETEPNINKVIQYSSIPVGNQVYLMIFECPEKIAEEIFNDFSTLLDYIVVFNIQ